jgi:hypothetical protein
MKSSKLAEFEAFAAEFKSESDRAAVILGAAKLDLLLYQVLQKVLRPAPGKSDELLDGDAPLGTFSSRITMCHRLGLIDDEFARALNLTRRIRNSFAHELSGVSLNGGAHRDRVRELLAAFKNHGALRWLLDTYFKDSQPSSEFRAAVALMSKRLEGIFQSEDTVFCKQSWSLLPPAWTDNSSAKNADAVPERPSSSVASSKAVPRSS